MSEILPGFAEPSKPNWEYRVYTADNRELTKERHLTEPELKQEIGAVEAAMNELGKVGWELIPSIVQLGMYQLMVFRRLK